MLGRNAASQRQPCQGYNLTWGLAGLDGLDSGGDDALSRRLCAPLLLETISALRSQGPLPQGATPNQGALAQQGCAFCTHGGSPLNIICQGCSGLLGLTCRAMLGRRYQLQSAPSPYTGALKGVFGGFIPAAAPCGGKHIALSPTSSHGMVMLDEQHLW